MVWRGVMVAACVAMLGRHAATAQDSGCFRTDEGVQCRGAQTVEEITAFLTSVDGAAENKNFHLFGIYSNPTLRHLPDGLLRRLRFQEVHVMECPNLSTADNFLGDTGDSVKVVRLHDNALTRVPPFQAPALTNLTIIQDSAVIQVQRSDLQGMHNLQYVRLHNIRVSALAFHDLGALRELEIVDLANTKLPAGAFHLTSPDLTRVGIVSYKAWKGQAEPGTYKGFPKGSNLWIAQVPQVTREIYYDLLSGGAHLTVPEPVWCDCHVAWIRLSPLLQNASVRCLTSMWPVELEYKDEASFKDCPKA